MANDNAEANHKARILRILKQSTVPLTVPEILTRANEQVLGHEPAYTEAEIATWLQQMPDVYSKGDKFGPKRKEDTSQAAARIVREATES